MTNADTVERAAKALYDAEIEESMYAECEPNWADVPSIHGKYMRMARAAIAALPPAVPEHPDDLAVQKFSELMARKMKASREKGRSGWDDPERCSVEYLRDLLYGHVAKGDPVDVANICMMLQHYNASTAPTTPDPVAEAAPPSAPSPKTGSKRLDPS